MKKNHDFENLSLPEQIRQMTQALIMSSLFFIHEKLAYQWQEIEMPDGKHYFACLLSVDKWELINGTLRLKAMGRLEDKDGQANGEGTL